MDHFQLPTLLIVSDNSPVRYWLKKHLEKQFYIIVAQKKEKALEVVQNTLLDFIILDSAFEDFEGIELCKEMRQFNLLVPILFVTGRLKKTYREEALAAGVTDFLFEPLDEDELETRIMTGLKAAEIRKKIDDLSDTIASPETELSSDYLHNKFLLETQALQLLANAREEQLPVTIAILRIDHFAKLVKKEILPPFSKLLSESITEKDLLVPMSEGRYLLLLSKNLEEGRETALKIREKIKQHRFKTEKGTTQLTATFAIVDLQNNENSFNEMIDTAIKTLKQADSVTNTIFSVDHAD